MAPIGTKFEFRAFLDGVQAFTQTVSWGESSDVELDLAKALRLRLTIVPIIPPGDTEFHAVWGDARVV